MPLPTLDVEPECALCPAAARCGSIAASSVAPIVELSALPASLRCARLSHPLNERHSGSTSTGQTLHERRDLARPRHAVDLEIARDEGPVPQHPAEKRLVELDGRDLGET